MRTRVYLIEVGTAQFTSGCHATFALTDDPNGLAFSIPVSQDEGRALAPRLYEWFEITIAPADEATS